MFLRDGRAGGRRGRDQSPHLCPHTAPRLPMGKRLGVPRTLRTPPLHRPMLLWTARYRLRDPLSLPSCRSSQQNAAGGRRGGKDLPRSGTGTELPSTPIHPSGPQPGPVLTSRGRALRCTECVCVLWEEHGVVVCYGIVFRCAYRPYGIYCILLTVLSDSHHTLPTSALHSRHSTCVLMLKESCIERAHISLLL